MKNLYTPFIKRDRQKALVLIGVFAFLIMTNLQAATNFRAANFIPDLSHAQVGQNLMQNTAASKNGTGIWTSNCLDCVFSENDLQNLDVGMQVRFDHTNTQFSCNDFDACVTGFYFFDATLSDQGDGTNGADNKWLNWNNSLYRMDGNTALVNNIDYHFDYSSSDYDPEANFGVSSIFSGNMAFIDTISNGCATYASQYKNTSESTLTKTRIYPNPADKTLTIESSQNFSYFFLDQVGKEVIRGHSDADRVEFKLSLPSGMYLLIVESELGSEHFKVIKR